MKKQKITNIFKYLLISFGFVGVSFSIIATPILISEIKDRNNKLANQDKQTKKLEDSKDLEISKLNKQIKESKDANNLPNKLIENFKTIANKTILKLSADLNEKKKTIANLNEKVISGLNNRITELLKEYEKEVSQSTNEIYTLRNEIAKLKNRIARLEKVGIETLKETIKTKS